MTYGDIRAGQWFGDFAAIDGSSRSADVIALEDTLAATLTPALFLRLLHEHPSVCDCMLRRLVGCVRDLTERIYDFSTLGVQNRVHAELLRLARKRGQGQRSPYRPRAEAQRHRRPDQHVSGTGHARALDDGETGSRSALRFCARRAGCGSARENRRRGASLGMIGSASFLMRVPLSTQWALVKLEPVERFAVVTPPQLALDRVCEKLEPGRIDLAHDRCDDLLIELQRFELSLSFVKGHRSVLL